MVVYQISDFDWCNEDLIAPYRNALLLLVIANEMKQSQLNEKSNYTS